MNLRPASRPFRVTLGERGEMMAWDFLLGRGYEIVEKNYRCPLGEIDIVARRAGRLAFVEVKTRRSLLFGTPEEAVTPDKQRRLVRLAQWYLKETGRNDVPVDFHVIAVDCTDEKVPRIKMIERAFVPGERENESFF